MLGKCNFQSHRYFANTFTLSLSSIYLLLKTLLLLPVQVEVGGNVLLWVITNLHDVVSEATESILLTVRIGDHLIDELLREVFDA